MAADWVVGFVLAAEAICAAGVDNKGAATGGLCQHFGGVDDQFGAGIGGEAGGWRCFDAAAGGKAGGSPGAPAAVENGDVPGGRSSRSIHHMRAAMLPPLSS